MAKKGSTKSSKKSKNVTTTTEVTVIPENSADVEKESILTPQQALFLQYYYNPTSPTWCNARGSAIAAGFGEQYADQITYRKPDWWLGMVRKENFMDKIHAHFIEVLNMPSVTQAIGMVGPVFRTEVQREDTGKLYKSGPHKGEKKFRNVKIKIPVMVPNKDIIKAKTDIAKIAAPAHDPDRYGKKAGNNNKFVFNMAVVKERYKT